MAIGYRGAGAYCSRSGANTNTLTVTQAAGTASGDLLLMVACALKSGSPATTINTPAGWTVVVDSGAWALNTGDVVVYQKIAGSSEPSVSLTTAAASFLDARISAFTGVDATTPIDAFAAWGTETGTTPTAVPAITTLTNNAWWVCVGADSGGLIAAGAAPAGFTSRSVSSTFATQFMFATLAVPTAGAQGATSYARTGSGGRGIATSVALRESGASPGSAFVPKIIVIS